MQTIDAAREWLLDMPQQFLGKRNIEILIEAFARQLDELLELFDGLNTDLDIDTAVGKNLDYVGTIIPLTRKEAGTLAELGKNEPVMSDDLYRQWLRYMELKNTSECTYEDIMRSIELLWDNDNIDYVEDPERPATILISLKGWDLDYERDPCEGKTKPIRPSGVQLLYTIIYSAIIDESEVETTGCPGIDIHTGIPYFRTLLLDGSVLLDGSNRLDATSNYDLRARIDIGGWKFRMDNTLDAVGLSVKDKISQDEGLVAKQADIIAPLDYWNRRDKDLQAVEVEGNAAAAIGVPIENCDETIDGSVLITRNLLFLDGSVNLDGGRIMNALYQKEEL